MFGDYFMKTVTVIKTNNVFFKQPKPTNERATSKTQKKTDTFPIKNTTLRIMEPSKKLGLTLYSKAVGSPNH